MLIILNRYDQITAEKVNEKLAPISLDKEHVGQEKRATGRHVEHAQVDAVLDALVR